MHKKIESWFDNFKQALYNIGFMFKYSWKVAKIVYLFAIINVIIQSISPFVYLIIPKYIIDELGGQQRWEYVLKYIFIFIGFIFTLKLINYIFSYFSSKNHMVIEMKNILIFFNHYLYMDYSRLEDNYVRDLGYRALKNLNPTQFVYGVVSPFLINLFQLIGYSYIIMQLHPLIIVVIMIIIYLNSIMSNKFAKLGYEFDPVFSKFSRRLSYLFNAMISINFAKEIRINNAAEWLNNKYSSISKEFIEETLNKRKKELKLDAINNTIGIGQLIVMYSYSAYQAIKGLISIGDFSVYLGAITNFTDCFNGFISHFANLKFLSKYVDDYHEFAKLSAPTHHQTENCNIDISGYTEHTIEFENVSFKYPNTDKYVLNKVSIKINSGERLSIVGYNGSGKSTFIKLLCRLYVPNEGRILYNGIDIQTINYDKYRDLLAVVFQDFRIFSFSVQENVVLDLPKNERDIETALDKSGLLEKIKTFPKGIETQLTKEFESDGIEFSGGEGQKLACARAIYRNAPIVILDEPTASLDPIAESRLYERFNNIVGKKTSIYISHRLASVQFCDKVAVFVEGEIKEYGTHQSLMAENGIYCEMFTKQAQYYVEEVTE